MTIKTISLALVAGAFLTQSANAAIITIAAEGTWGYGRDDYNLFAKGTDFSGKAAKMALTFDDETPNITIVNSGNNQHISGYGPNYFGYCCSPGYGYASVEDSLLENSGDYRSVFTLSNGEGQAWDSLQAISWDQYYIYENGNARYSIWNYFVIQVVGAQFLDNADLLQSRYIFGDGSVTINAQMEYRVYDYQNRGYIDYVYATLTSSGATVRVVGPDVDPPAPGVPEPATWTMLIAGFGIVGAASRRRKAVLSA